MKAALLACVLAIALPAAAQEPTHPEPKVQRTVVEDEAVRIEELRVRGQNQRIAVQVKKGPVGGRYEVVTPDSGRDPSLPGSKGAAGERVWHVLSF